MDQILKVGKIVNQTEASGTINLSANGTFDIKEYASAVVGVPVPKVYSINELIAELDNEFFTNQGNPEDNSQTTVTEFNTSFGTNINNQIVVVGKVIGTTSSYYQLNDVSELNSKIFKIPYPDTNSQLGIDSLNLNDVVIVVIGGLDETGFRIQYLSSTGRYEYSNMNCVAKLSYTPEVVEGATEVPIYRSDYIRDNYANHIESTIITYGYVTSSSGYNESYGNISDVYITHVPSETAIHCYRVSGDGASTLVVGDFVIVKGIVKEYNGALELYYPEILSTFTPESGGEETVEMYRVLSADEAATEALSLVSGSLSSDLVVVYGKVSGIKTAWSDAYNNMTPYLETTGDKSFSIYRNKSHSYVGDYLVVKGYLQNYNGTAQISNSSQSTLLFADVYSTKSKMQSIIDGTITEITRSDLNDITVINGYAFYGCNNLTSVEIPYNISNIGGYAFYYCQRLENVTIEDGVRYIGEYAFCWCYSLTNIVIPNTVETIGDSAFRYCSALTDVTIGTGVTSIGSSVFQASSSLTSITYAGTTGDWENISLSSDWNYGSSVTQIICSDGTITL